MHHHVTPLLERNTYFLSDCSLIVGLSDVIKKSSDTLRFFVYSGAVVNT